MNISVENVKFRKRIIGVSSLILYGVSHPLSRHSDLHVPLSLAIVTRSEKSSQLCLCKRNHIIFHTLVHVDLHFLLKKKKKKLLTYIYVEELLV